MNAALWQAHLENLELRRRLQRAYTEANKQRRRAELWKQRALHKPHKPRKTLTPGLSLAEDPGASHLAREAACDRHIPDRGER